MRTFSEWLKEHLSTWQECSASELVDLYLSQEQPPQWFEDQMKRRALTEMARAELRKKKPNGVPLYLNLREADETGEIGSTYRRSEACSPDEREQVIRSHEAQIFELIKTNVALRDETYQKFGIYIQLRFDLPNEGSSAA